MKKFNIILHMQVVQLVLLSGVLSYKTNAQQPDYDFNNWPGKDGDIITNLSIPEQFVLEHDLVLTKGSDDTLRHYKIALFENDLVKKGRIDVIIYPTVDTAQLALITEFIEAVTDPDKPSMLTAEEYNSGDVAFGYNQNGRINMAFTRNNILVMIRAPEEKTKIIASQVDGFILNAAATEK